ncbi:MAG: hypothetical protein QF809_02745 [Candidatus Peribacteraceae bacterium]|nr:hypothetical protein [Candidatus Peribacteraceae bacterium]|tara:strand:- start:51 stop:329 length:279 start_codon:yes stop_codon:yes gene_type:complete
MHTQTFKSIIEATVVLPNALKEKLVNLAADLDDETKKEIVAAIKKEAAEETDMVEKQIKAMLEVRRSVRRDYRGEQEKVDRKNEMDAFPSFD